MVILEEGGDGQARGSGLRVAQITMGVTKQARRGNAAGGTLPYTKIESSTGLQLTLGKGFGTETGASQET